MKSNRENFESALVELRKKWKVAQDEGTDYSKAIPDKTMKECFNDRVAEHPDKPYVIHRDVVYTYGEVNQKAQKLAQGLRKLGCVKGDRCAIYLGNTVNYVIATQACFKIGLILVNSNPFDLDYEVKRRLDDCGARVAFFDELSTVAVCLAARDSASVEYLVNCDEVQVESDATNYKIISLSKILEDNDATEPEADLDPDDVQVLQYTGGTTGTLKGCCVTHRNYLYHAYAADEYYGPVVKSEEWSVSLGLPLSHAYAFTCTVTASVMNGGTMIFTSTPRATIDEVLRNVEKYKATIWPAVPALLFMALNEPGLLTRYDLSSLKCVFSGSAPLPVAIIDEFERITGSRVSEGYGLTEAVTTITLSPFGVRRAGKTGIPFPHLDALIVDLETGSEVQPANVPGEIIARGPQITKGYWQKPEETAANYRDGWLYTGDIGYFDDEGILAIIGRIKDLIIVSGFNVYPKEIDELLSTHPDVFESATIGVPDEKRGEVPKSFIVKREGSTPDAEEIREFLHDRLVGYKVPRSIQFVDAIPRTKLNKVDKAQLKTL